MPSEQETPAAEGYLTVSELHQRLNALLKAKAANLSFQGEISQFTLARSGHLYLSIKDEKSQIAAVMWRSHVSRLGFSVEEGMSVLCEGDANIYHGNGKFQIVLSRLTPAGEGLLRKRYIELKAKLEKEGLFDPERKRALPFLPRSVGIVTSKSGAAVHDIMTKIRERMPQTRVLLYDAKVQGAGSVEDVVAGITWFNRQKNVEVLIIGRGGGSLEDLWTFNEEAVARAVFASKIPVISAVGHEVDVALTDLVADLRSPTPTAAGERVVPSRKELLQQLSQFAQRLDQFDLWFRPLSQRVDELEMRLSNCAGRVVADARERLASLRADLHLLRPDRRLSELRGRLSLIEEHFRSALEAGLVKKSNRLAVFESRLDLRDLRKVIVQYRGRVDSDAQRLLRAARVVITRSDSTVTRLQKTLEAVSPLRVLERGYSVVRLGNSVVRDAAELSKGDTLRLAFHKGGAEATVSALLKDSAGENGEGKE